MKLTALDALGMPLRGCSVKQLRQFGRLPTFEESLDLRKYWHKAGISLVYWAANLIIFFF